MTKHRRILNYISIVRNAHPSMVEIYTRGSCMNFFYQLRSIYPEAKAYYNGSHVITKIGKYYYDITGVVKNTKKYLLYGESYYKKDRVSRGFNQMINN